MTDEVPMHLGVESS